jgi:uncharacterized protein YecE (DUF72 family)
MPNPIPFTPIHIGCAGWSIPKAHADRFPTDGTHLSRYAGSLPAAEINSSFYRPHKPSTYEKWAASVPAAFRFAVKVPKTLTHERRLKDAEAVLDRFLPEVRMLGDKLGPLLVQLPPSLAFAGSVAEQFLNAFRDRHDGSVVLEPRHESWFGAEAEVLLTRSRVARVAADPAVLKAASVPGGWGGLKYYRLHGSPKMYYSKYPDEYLETLSTELITAAQNAEVWCIFDNTAEGAATANALDLVMRVRNQNG